ncbi:MAG: hypothetical protein WKF84_23225 [Pyrinomonadaceae bacterium]
MKAKSITPTNADVLFEFAMVALTMSLYEDAAQTLAIALKKRRRTEVCLWVGPRTNGKGQNAGS